MLRIKSPFLFSTITQGFGENQVNYRTIDDTVGHPGIDFLMPWGTPIPNGVAGCFVSAILSKDNPNLDAFRAVNTIIDDEDNSYEIQYGHCSDITCKVGDTPKVGDVVANVGNTGTVYHNDVLVTAAQKYAGSHEGQHLHFQVRLLKKVNRSLMGKGNYLNDGSGLLVVDDFVYQIVNYDNGYHGCIDPMPFLYEKEPATHTEDQPVVVVGLKDSESIAVLAAQKVAAGNTAQANVLFALANFLKAFGY